MKYKCLENIQLNSSKNYIAGVIYSPADLTDEAEAGVQKYFEKIEEQYTEEALKAKSKAEQDEILKEMGLDPTQYKKEADRINAILGV